MQSNRFVVLTGHLSNYPLPDLVGILRHQRKSGRLLIEYAKGPAMFFFQDGELIDARMNDLIGLQAICVALAQPEASFNFNPLIQSPRRSIEPSLQRAVSELFGCWDEGALQIETTLAPQPEILALPPAPPVLVRQRSVLLVAAAVLMVVGLSTVIAVTGGFTKNEAAATAASLPQSSSQPVPVTAVPSEPPVHKTAPETVARSTRAASERREEKRSKPEPVASEPEPKPEPEPASQSIKVVMQIENGRVLKASIANPKPGMDSYEAMALRIARQRRFPSTVTGGETVTINVNK
jgi:hypothetical protein